MNSKEFLKEELKKLYSKFEDVQIRYEYRENTNSHIIEIIPLSFFEENESYLLAESMLEDKFESLFPMENVVFISNDSLTEINTPDLKLGYDLITFSNDNCFSPEFEIEGYTQLVEPRNIEGFALAA